MKKEKKLVIIGAGEFAEIVYEYFSLDSEYEVIAFSVEKAYYNNTILRGLPIIKFEDIKQCYPPEDFEVFVAVYYGKLNRDRTRLFELCKSMGYTCATYVSTRAFVWHNVRIGENSFVFEDNTLQYNVNIGDNVVLWSGNHIGHRTIIEDNCWITSQVVISGFCRIGKNAFIGVNATIGDEVIIPEDTVLGAGSVTIKSIMIKGGVYVGNPIRKLDRSAYEQFDINEGEI